MSGNLAQDFYFSIKSQAWAFGVEVSDDAIQVLEEYRALVEEANELLHLIGPHTAQEFAVRHVLESLTVVKHLPQNATFTDVGPGAGLPSIPCLIVRKDLRGILVESKEKKAGFLTQVINECGLRQRAAVVNRQFEEIEKPGVQFVTCRALDKFVDKLPKLIKWSKGSKLLLFGGPALGEALTANNITYKSELMPMSNQRFLFICE